MRRPGFIGSNPEVLGGKPVVRGTRLSVDFVLGLFAAGWKHEQVLENSRALGPEALRAVLACAAEALADDTPIPVRTQSA